MTEEQFLKKYHDYSTDNYMEALSDALKINSLYPDLHVVPVKLGDKYCIMLKKAADLVAKIF